MFTSDKKLCDFESSHQLEFEPRQSEHPFQGGSEGLFHGKLSRAILYFVTCPGPLPEFHHCQCLKEAILLCNGSVPHCANITPTSSVRHNCAAPFPTGNPQYPEPIDPTPSCPSCPGLFKHGHGPVSAKKMQVLFAGHLESRIPVFVGFIGVMWHSWWICPSFKFPNLRNACPSIVVFQQMP